MKKNELSEIIVTSEMPKPYLDKYPNIDRSVFKTISQEGSIGKTVIALTFVAWCKARGIPLAKYACDDTLQDLAEVYGIRDEKGKLKEKTTQNPLIGVRQLKLNKDHRLIYESLRDYPDTAILEDHGAKGMDLQLKLYKDPEDYVFSYSDRKRLLYYYIPVATKDKSFQTVDMVADYFRGIDHDNIMRYVFVINKGYMEKRNTEDIVMEAYNNSDSVKELKDTGNSMELIMDAPLEESMVAVLKKYQFEKFDDLYEDKSLYVYDSDVIKQHMRKMFRQFDKLFSI